MSLRLEQRVRKRIKKEIKKKRRKKAQNAAFLKETVKDFETASYDAVNRALTRQAFRIDKEEYQDLSAFMLKDNDSANFELAALYLGKSVKMQGEGLEGQDVTTQDSTEQDIGEHISPDGWAVNYAVPVMEAHEIDEHTASFVYTGESAGTNMVTISYVPGKQPEEAMTEITDTWGDDETLERSEGFFPGTEDKWGYWRSIAHAENGSGFSETLIGGEYNGGVLLFDIVSHNGSDEEQNITVSDHLSAVIDSIRYENFGPQTMYEYYPGTYSRTDEDTGAVYSVILNEDHTGTLAFQDSVDIFWGSYQVTTTDGNYVYEYTIEGDDLLFDHNGIWATYTREGTDRD